MEWVTHTFSKNRQQHYAETEKCKLYVYDWLGGKVKWTVYDHTGNKLLYKGNSTSADDAKIAAEESIKEGA